jgi:hypothetical protein
MLHQMATMESTLELPSYLNQLEILSHIPVPLDLAQNVQLEISNSIMKQESESTIINEKKHFEPQNVQFVEISNPKANQETKKKSKSTKMKETNLEEVFSYSIRKVDSFVAEYNGKPIFIDLDSLLIHCLIHPLIDTKHGLSIVQIINCVELLIQKFNQKIILISFECLENLWTNASSRLARKLIKQHFKNFQFHIEEFFNWGDKDFEKYCEYSSPEFVLTTNPNGSMPSSIHNDAKQFYQHQICFYLLNKVPCRVHNRMRAEKEGIYSLEFLNYNLEPRC